MKIKYVISNATKMKVPISKTLHRDVHLPNSLQGQVRIRLNFFSSCHLFLRKTNSSLFSANIGNFFVFYSENFLKYREI